jgi:hypothetical protein
MQHLRAGFTRLSGDASVFAAVLLLVSLTHALSPIATSFDSRWAIYTAESIVHQGNTDLDEYEEEIAQNQFYAIERADGHYYCLFPLGPALLAVPFVWALEELVPRWAWVAGLLRSPALLADGMGDDSGSPTSLILRRHALVERLIASFIVALSAGVIYLIGRQFLSGPPCLLLAGIYAFGTSAWSTASRALWQHGPSMLMLAIAVYLLLLARKKPALAQFASLPLAFSYVIRPTNSISIALLSMFVAHRHRKYLLRYLLWGVVIAIPFVVYNWATYRALLPPYYAAQRVFSRAHFWEALAGNLVSPSRGLLVFSPVFAFSIVGLVCKRRNRQMESLDYFLVAIIGLHLVAISSFPHWWGGHCYGPRFFSDMVPYLTYFLIPVLSGLAGLPARRRMAAVSGFVLLAAASLFMHYRGAVTWDVYQWNAEPVSVDVDPARLWDWRDPQFLRGIR